MTWRPSFRTFIGSTCTSICRTCRLRIASRDQGRSYATSVGASRRLTPATTWDGLEWVGTPELVKKHKAPHIVFKPFVPSKVPEDQVMDEFLKAVVEVFQFKKQNVPLDKLDDVSPDFQWPPGVEIKYDKSKDAPTISYLNITAENSLLESLGLRETGNIQSEELVEPTSEITATVATSDLTWEDIPLENMDLRFALIKRVMRRTGRRAPDSKIVEATTVFKLYSHLWSDIKAKKLAEVIEEDDLLDIPNVKVSPRKVTSVDKDITEGRWKVIRKELERRNLPEFDTENWVDEYKRRKGESRT